MKKFFVITLSCVIILLSFAFCFADDTVAPVILPQGSSTDYSTGYVFKFANNVERTYRSEFSPMYMVAYSLDDGATTNILNFSDIPNNHFYFNNVGDSNSQSRILNNQYNGYYYLSTNVQLDSSVLVMFVDGDSVEDVIDYVNNTVFSTAFDLTYLVDGSVNWLSSMAQAVKTNGLLLFFVLFIFVGVGIGLLKRFSN